VFSVHVLHNPDQATEESLLAKYAPHIFTNPGGPHLISQLASSFSELRQLHSDGRINYPYSMREAVAVAKHLDAFPTDGIVPALQNVLAFDSFNASTWSLVAKVFQNNGIPLPSDVGGQLGSPNISLGVTSKLRKAEVKEKWT
jgi:von Willebrand factor A domain-containing protein 8